MKDEHQRLKDENFSLKASSDNHIFINEKLNRALKKATDQKAKKDKKSKKAKGAEADTDIEPVDKKDDNIGATGGSNFEMSAQQTNEQTNEEKKGEESFGGDISSIMIAPMEME